MSLVEQHKWINGKVFVHSAEESLKRSGEIFLHYPFQFMDSSLDGTGRILHLMWKKEGYYSDLFSAWIIRRPILPGNDNLASQIILTGAEICKENPQSWYDHLVQDALERMEPFEDGGKLPLNDKRLETING